MTMTKSRKQENGNNQAGYEEAYQNWTNLYQQMANEGMTFFQKSVEATQEMMPNPEQHQEMYQHWNESFLNFMQEAGSDGQIPDPESYKKLYNVWLDTWSKNFEGYMRSPEFVKNSGKNLEAFSDAKSQMGDMLEEYWHNIHLPSTRDMKEVYHKLYIMERKQDEQDRKLDEISATLKEILKETKNLKTAPKPTASASPAKAKVSKKTKTTKKAK